MVECECLNLRELPPDKMWRVYKCPALDLESMLSKTMYVSCVGYFNPSYHLRVHIIQNLAKLLTVNVRSLLILFADWIVFCQPLPESGSLLVFLLYKWRWRQWHHAVLLIPCNKCPSALWRTASKISGQLMNWFEEIFWTRISRDLLVHSKQVCDVALKIIW